MLEDRTEATLETDAFATKAELISSPRSSTNTESFRLQGARSSFSYTDRNRELGKPIGRARISRQSVAHQDHLGETLVLLCMRELAPRSSCRKSLVKLFAMIQIFARQNTPGLDF